MTKPDRQPGGRLRIVRRDLDLDQRRQQEAPRERVCAGDAPPHLLPRALRALQVMNRPAPTAPPAGYVGWPLWYHRVCLVHNRAFGWLYIVGLVVGAVAPSLRIG